MEIPVYRPLPVPDTAAPDAAPRDDGPDALAALLRDRPALALTGAGISTDSGIPDYRGPASLARRRTPMLWRTFVTSEAARRRYWARSLVGWPAVARARPNAAHEAVARLEDAGALTGVVTQNVDGLHQAAGSVDALELHGGLARVTCLACGTHEPRSELQERMRAANPGTLEAAEIAPDGDAELPDDVAERFDEPRCLACGAGPLKPDVVFFGENVPKERVRRAYERLDAAGALVVLGSSLAVFSGYRFVARAKEQGKPVAIVNDGATRGDAEADVRLAGRLGDVLPRVAAEVLE